MEFNKCDVNDKSKYVGGHQCLTTPDGYVIPLIIRNGLPQLKIRPYADGEWTKLPQVFLTSELEWNPSVLDHDPTEDEQWFDAISEPIEHLPTAFDEFGNYRHRVNVQHADYLTRGSDRSADSYIDHCVYHAHQHPSSDFCETPEPTSDFYDAHEHEMDHRDDTVGEPPPTSPQSPNITHKEPNYDSLRPMFGWLSPQVIKKTLQNTTQYARIPTGTLLKRFFKSPNPALNVHRRSEPVGTDIIYADTPAVDDGSTAAVLFVGIKTQVTDIYGIKTDKQFVNTLEDNI